MKKITVSKNLKNLFFVFLIALFAFFVFEPLLARLGLKAGQEYIVAIFGTIITAVITMLLLGKQTETEEEKNRNSKVFEQKIDIYNQALAELENIFSKSDDQNCIQISKSEIVRIEFLLAKIMMVGGYKTINVFRNFYENLTDNYSPETGLLHFNSVDRQIVFRFSACCREELGLADQKIEEHIMEDIVLQSELLYNFDGLTNFDDTIVEMIKDLYGFLVFTLKVDFRNIRFATNGFWAYTSKKKNDESCFFTCMADGQRLWLPLDGHFRLKNTMGFSVVESEGKKSIVLYAADYDKFKLNFLAFQKAIIVSYNELTKHRKFQL